MAPNRIKKACNAMKIMDIPEEKVMPVLNQLLKTYCNTWKFIEAERYKLLVEAILDQDQESEQKEGKKEESNDVAMTRGKKRALEQTQLLLKDEEDDSDEDVVRLKMKSRRKLQSGCDNNINLSLGTSPSKNPIEDEHTQLAGKEADNVIPEDKRERGCDNNAVLTVKHTQLALKHKSNDMDGDELQRGCDNNTSLRLGSISSKKPHGENREAEEENEVPELPPSKRYSRRTGEKVSARTVDNNTSPSFNSSMSTEDFPPVMTLPTAHVVAIKESVPSALTIVNNDTIIAQKPMIPDAENFSAHVLVTDTTAMEVPPSENTSLNSNDNGQKTLTATRGLGKDRGDNDKTVKTPLVITATPLEKTEAEPESVMNLNDFGNDSTPHKTHEEEKSRKTKRGQGQHLKNLNEEADGNTNVSTAVEMNDTTSKNLCHDGEVVDQLISSWIGNSSSELSSDQSLNVMNNSAVTATCTEETPVKDTLTDLPFTKKSPYWKTYETTEGFKSVPQRPHFSKLLEAKKDFFLESAAVGMMVTFYGLLDEVKDLKLDDSTSKLNDLNVYFAELEKNGFDVEAPQAVISKVLSLKDVRDKKAEVQKRSEENIEAEESTSRDLKKKRAELELRISELQRQNAEGKQKEKAAEENIAVMKAHVEMIGREIEDLEVDFQKTILMYLHGNKLNETSR